MTANNTSTDLTFDALANTLLIHGALVSPAELHGLIAGVLTTGQRPNSTQWLRLCYQHMGIKNITDKDHQRQLQQLAALTLAELSAGEFGLQLLLPEDDYELSQRLASIGLWCSGFLSGIGLTQAGVATKAAATAMDTKSEEHSTIDKPGQSQASSHDENRAETLSTFAEIAQISTQVEADAQPEEQEQDYMLLVEYVRLAAIDLFEQANPPLASPDASTTHTEVLH